MENSTKQQQNHSCAEEHDVRGRERRKGEDTKMEKGQRHCLCYSKIEEWNWSCPERHRAGGLLEFFGHLQYTWLRKLDLIATGKRHCCCSVSHPLGFWFHLLLQWPVLFKFRVILYQPQAHPIFASVSQEHTHLNTSHWESVNTFGKILQSVRFLSPILPVANSEVFPMHFRESLIKDNNFSLITLPQPYFQYQGSTPT